MSTAKGKTALPFERGCAWAAAFLLAAFLFVTLIGSMGLQMLTSAGLHLSVAADEGMLDRQLDQIYANIDLMAREYGFSADEVKAEVSREELKEMNRKAAEWWTHLLTEGEEGTTPRWHSGTIDDIIYAATERKELREEPQTIVTDLTEMMENTVFPMRETTLAFGTKLTKDEADIKGIIRSVRKLPLLGFMMSLACAGVIALSMGREFFRTLKYYGTAMAAAGLSLIAACILFVAARPEAIIAEASVGLAREFSTMARKIGAGAGIAAAVLLAAGYCCLFLYCRKAENANRKPVEMTE